MCSEIVADEELDEPSEGVRGGHLTGVHPAVDEHDGLGGFDGPG